MGAYQFVRVGRHFINLDQIRYADWYKEEPRVQLYFADGETLALTGDDATRMAQILDRMAG